MKKYSPEILEAWATWELLRRLGFKSDDIFWIFGRVVGAPRSRSFGVSIVLRAQEKEFTIACSDGITKRRARGLMAEAARLQNAIAAGAVTEDEMRTVFDASYARVHAAELVTVLRLREFVFPFTLEGMN